MLVAAAFLAGSMWIESAAAADSDAASQAPTYSTGKSGAKLKWLPRRAAPADDAAKQIGNLSRDKTDPAVTAVQYKTSSDSPRAVRTVQYEKSSPKSLDKPDADLLTLPAEPKPLGEQGFVLRQHEFKEDCPSPKDLKQIKDLTTNITPDEGELPNDCPLGGATFYGRSFVPITFSWTASGLCHKPLYFEDVQLERYGHMAGPWVQPFASVTNFFLTVPILPYKMGLEVPSECMYTLGYYRPGNCAPYMFDPLPLSVRGALFEAGAWVGGAAIIP